MARANTPASFRSGFTVRRNRTAIATAIGVAICVVGALAVVALVGVFL